MTDITYGNRGPCCGRGSMVDIECPCKADDRDVQIDFYPASSRQPVIWGTVYDDCNRPLSGGIVRLLQCNDKRGGCCMVMGETCSDCDGHYEIPLPPSCQGKYRIEVSAPCGCREPEKRKNNICYY